MTDYPRIIEWLTSERFPELFPNIDVAKAEIIRRQHQRGVVVPNEIGPGMQKALTDFYEAIEKQRVIAAKVRKPIVVRIKRPLKFKRIKIIKKGRLYVIFRNRRGQIQKRNIKTGRLVHYKVPKKRKK